MDDLKEILENRLEEKKRYYDESLQLFLETVESEGDTGCFERNSVTDLMVLNQLKCEIRQLRDIILLVKLCERD